MYEPSCLGMVAPDFNPMGECADGYEGVACADCMKGYYRLSNYQCTECPDFVTNISVFCVIVVIVILIMMFIIKLAIDGANDKTRKSSVFFRILIDHIHMIIFIASFNFNWTYYIKTFLEGYGPFS